MSNDRKDPKNYVIGPDASISEIDLDTEVFLAPDGTRLTEEKAEQLAREALADRRKANLVPGRKSLGKSGSHSPIVQFRTPRRDEAQALADDLGLTMSEFARRAFHALLDRVAALSPEEGQELILRHGRGEAVAQRARDSVTLRRGEIELSDSDGFVTWRIVRVDHSGHKQSISEQEVELVAEALAIAGAHRHS